VDREQNAGAERADAIARPIMEEVRRIVGFWRP
jgi:tryptophanyl-tRNA synthetase